MPSDSDLTALPVYIDTQFLSELKALDRVVDLSVLKQDVLPSLRIDENNINGELEKQPSLTFRWQAIAIRISKIVAMYEATVFRRIKAHFHFYSKQYMRAIDEKDTIDGREEYSVLLFGQDVTSKQKWKNAEIVLRGFLKTELGTIARALKFQSEDSRKWIRRKFVTAQQVYPEGLMPYEQVMQEFENLKERQSIAQAIADTFKQRGIAVTSIASNMRSAQSGDGIVLKALNANTNLLQRIRQTIINNPNATPETLMAIIQSYGGA